MEDNTQRGKRTLFWLKLTFALFILVGVLALVFFGMLTGSNILEPGGEGDITDFDFATFIVLALFVIVAGNSSIVWCVSGIFWLTWLFKITKNLRTVTTTTFGPWVAVICSSLPYVGTIFHYFIFKNLAKRTEEVLASKQSTEYPSVARIVNQAKPVPMNLINGFLIMSILSGLVTVVKNESAVVVLAAVFGVVSYICYLKSFAALIQEEKVLFDACQEEMIQSKVDRVLREREIEKAVSQIREATFRTENSSDNEVVPPPPPER